MANLKGSKTEQNLKDAFAGESQANRRYLYFAQKADVEGFNDVAAVFRSTAEGETGHAHGHLEFLEETWAIRRPASRSARPRKNLEARRSRARPTNTPTCIRAWRAGRPPGRFRRNRRVVRNPGEGRKESRRPLPEGARHPRRLNRPQETDPGRWGAPPVCARAGSRVAAA
jgi:hypothetical protein